MNLVKQQRSDQVHNQRSDMGECPFMVERIFTINFSTYVQNTNIVSQCMKMHQNVAFPLKDSTFSGEGTPSSEKCTPLNIFNVLVPHPQKNFLNVC